MIFYQTKNTISYLYLRLKLQICNRFHMDWRGSRQPSALKIHRVSTKSLLRVVCPLQAQIYIECPTNFMRYLDNEANPILEHMLAPIVTIRLDFRLRHSRVSIKPNGYLFSAIQNHFQTHFMVECPQKNNRGRSRLHGNRALYYPRISPNFNHTENVVQINITC